MYPNGASLRLGEYETKSRTIRWRQRATARASPLRVLPKDGDDCSRFSRLLGLFGSVWYSEVFSSADPISGSDHRYLTCFMDRICALCFFED